MPPEECGSIEAMTRRGERMVSKAYRREPTTQGYHTGTRVEACGESNAKRKSCLTFAFFSPRVPMEIFSEWRRHMALTKRQKEVLDYLVAFETKHGYAPSFE